MLLVTVYPTHSQRSKERSGSSFVASFPIADLGGDTKSLISGHIKALIMQIPIFSKNKRKRRGNYLSHNEPPARAGNNSSDQIALLAPGLGSGKGGVLQPSRFIGLT